MRIVAGTFSSRKIEAPKGYDTRPTLDIVRGAVFSSLGCYFDGGLFLDLYAGSGANGLEALSRGFDKTIFVDNDRKAILAIKSNINNLEIEDKSEVLYMSDKKALEYFKNNNYIFDMVYLDPPYQKQHNETIMEFLLENGLLKDGSRIIIESDKNDIFDKTIISKNGILKPIKDALYGNTRITYYRKEEQ